MPVCIQRLDYAVGAALLFRNGMRVSHSAAVIGREADSGVSGAACNEAVLSCSRYYCCAYIYIQCLFWIHDCHIYICIYNTENDIC